MNNVFLLANGVDVTSGIQSWFLTSVLTIDGETLSKPPGYTRITIGLTAD